MAGPVNRVVRAAGGVVWRSGSGDTPEVLLVHRPRYDDWSLPKGKLRRGEHRLAAAVREVWEESGVTASPQVRLPSVRYLTGEPGVEKLVDYWSMAWAADHGHQPGDEVDLIEWLPVPSARRRLTYAHDRGVVAAFEALPPVTGTVVLVRHASAGRRAGWPGPDDDRPLDHAGHRDAERAAPLLALFAPRRVLSAPPRRCRDTVAPLTGLVGAQVELDGRFAHGGDVDEARDTLRAFAAAGGATVVCSQGELIRPLLAQLRGAVTDEPETDKGTGWVLTFAAGGDLVAADPLDLRVPAA
jgi:8-oxo-dGTP diphosphatase